MAAGRGCYRRAMPANRRPRAARAFLALALYLALPGPGAAGPATAADARGSLAAGPAAGPEQGLLRDRPGPSLVTPASKRDERERPGSALPGMLAVAVAAAGTLVAGHRAGRAGGRRVAAGARAPPPLQPAHV
jgi:hypothetical protein